MARISNAWRRFRIQIRDLRPQLRLCLRVTIAALASFVLGKSLNVPFGGLWTGLTAVVVTQMSVGGSLKATIEYFTGTLGGAVYAGVITVLIPPTNEFALLMALAIAVAPLALLAAINAGFRVAPFTAVFVVVGSSVTHAGPVDSALYRVLEVAIGGGSQSRCWCFQRVLTFWQSKRSPECSISWPGFCPSCLMDSCKRWRKRRSCKGRTASTRHLRNWPRSRLRRRASGRPILPTSPTQDRCCVRFSGCATTLS